MFFKDSSEGFSGSEKPERRKKSTDKIVECYIKSIGESPSGKALGYDSRHPSGC